MRSKSDHIRAGDLDKQVSVQSVARVSDGQGGYTDTWAAISGMPVWANIEPAKGRELYLAQQLQFARPYTVAIRYMSTVTGAMRVLFGTRVFRIGSLHNPGEYGEKLVMVCEEIPA